VLVSPARCRGLVFFLHNISSFRCVNC
jgi:hypothetical protein